MLGDAEFGESATLRQALHRADRPYALGVSSTLKVFVGTPGLVPPPPPRAWRVVSWRNGTQPV